MKRISPFSTTPLSFDAPSPANSHEHRVSLTLLETAISGLHFFIRGVLLIKLMLKTSQLLSPKNLDIALFMAHVGVLLFLQREGPNKVDVLAYMAVDEIVLFLVADASQLTVRVLHITAIACSLPAGLRPRYVVAAPQIAEPATVCARNFCVYITESKKYNHIPVRKLEFEIYA